MNYFLLVTKYGFRLIFTLLLRYFCCTFGEVKKFGVILKGKSAMSRLLRMCLAQPGFGSVLLPPVYYRPNKPDVTADVNR